MEHPRLRDCERCPRLVAKREAVRAEFPDYHAAPVAAWGRRSAKLLIVGLAPGMHGANRTGRPFSGDASGDFLFQALFRAGFASTGEARTARLTDCRITNAVKCLPPGNRPLAGEISNCRTFLAAELETLCGRAPRRPRGILCLGRVAHAAVAAALNPSIAAFQHGRISRVSENLYLADTYHPSRLNTNTGRLTTAMLDQVLADVRSTLGAGSRPG